MNSIGLCTNPHPVTSNSIVMNVGPCNITINIKAFLEGYYIRGADSMRAVMDPFNYPSICDSVTLQLADSASLQIVAGNTKTINTHGAGTFSFTGLQLGHRYYLVLRHRNSLATWSKNSFLFNNSSLSYDFTSP